MTAPRDAPRGGPAIAPGPGRWVAMAAGLLAYNWWIVTAMMPATFPVTGNQMYSDLESRGAPHAAWLRAADALASVLFVVTGLGLRRASSRVVTARQFVAMRRGLVAVGCCGLVGAAFPYTCSEGTTPGCREREWRFQLPWYHYLHNVAGIAEFVALAVIVLAPWAGAVHWRPPRVAWARIWRPAGWTAVALAVTGSVLGICYLLDEGQTITSSVMMVAYSATLVLPLLAAVDPAASG